MKSLGKRKIIFTKLSVAIGVAIVCLVISGMDIPSQVWEVSGGIRPQLKGRESKHTRANSTPLDTFKPEEWEASNCEFAKKVQLSSSGRMGP